MKRRQSGMTNLLYTLLATPADYVKVLRDRKRKRVVFVASSSEKFLKRDYEMMLELFEEEHGLKITHHPEFEQILKDLVKEGWTGFTIMTDKGKMMVDMWLTAGGLDGILVGKCGGVPIDEDEEL